MNQNELVDAISVNTQSSIRIGADKVIYFDPIEIRSAAHDADVIFITHEHGDHFDPESIRNICRDDTVLAAPASMSGQLGSAGIPAGRTVLFSPGEKKEAGGIAAEAVPAYNILKPFHPRRKGWVGYIVTIDGARIYVAGDTDAVKEVKAVKCDIALVPIGGKFTMDAKKAAEFINTIQPSIAIPTHYGSIVGKKEDADVFAAGVKAPIRTEIKMLY